MIWYKLFNRALNSRKKYTIIDIKTNKVWSFVDIGHLLPPLTTFTTFVLVLPVFKLRFLFSHNSLSLFYCSSLMQYLESTFFGPFPVGFIGLYSSSIHFCYYKSLFWSSKSFILSFKDNIDTSFYSSFFFKNMLSTLCLCWIINKS